MELKKLQERLEVSDRDVYGMIEVLLKAGYGKSAFAFLCQSGQTYSSAFDVIRAGALNEGMKKLRPEDLDLVAYVIRSEMGKPEDISF